MKLKYKVNGEEFTLAGEASSKFKKVLKQLGVDDKIIRKISIAMYEAELNMVIHANGGEIYADINPNRISIILEDSGPGIPDIEQAMQEGYSTANDKIREMGFGAGMGLPNMKRYSDNLKVTSKVGKGTKVEMLFNIFIER